MKQNFEKDYNEFKSIIEENFGDNERLKGYLKAVRERGLDSWWCRCYESAEEFNKLFPSASESKEVINNMKEIEQTATRAVYLAAEKIRCEYGGFE